MKIFHVFRWKNWRLILPVNWNEKVPSFLVKVFAEEDYIYFTIIDDGCGMEPEFVEAICDMKSDVGHGLKNVIKQIALYYGEGCGLTIQSTVEIGTTIEIRLLK